MWSWWTTALLRLSQPSPRHSLDPPFSGSLTLNGTTLALSILQDDGIDNLSLAINFDTTNDTYSIVTKNSEWYYSHTVTLNGTDITSQLTAQ